VAARAGEFKVYIVESGGWSHINHRPFNTTSILRLKITMTNRIEAQCRAKGMRLTGPRRVIAQVLAEARDHPDAAELHRRVVEKDPHVSLPDRLSDR
jgi:hypothetical protein